MKLTPLLLAAMAPEHKAHHNMSRRQKRALARFHRMSHWAHCGPRQRERYARQVTRGSLKIENGLAA